MGQDIKTTLEERGSRYGTAECNAALTYALNQTLKMEPNYDKLTPMHIETYHMIFHKISRSVCGDPFYVDNIHDVVGYAKLLEEYLNNFEIEERR